MCVFLSANPIMVLLLVVVVVVVVVPVCMASAACWRAVSGDICPYDPCISGGTMAGGHGIG